MAGFGDMVQKAFYLGVGLASYAGEKAGSTLVDLRSQVQKLADEMVARGEISAEEAKRMVEEMLNRAQQPSSQTPNQTSSQTDQRPVEPRRIEILTDEDVPANPPAASAADELRQQVEQLQAELRRLKRN